MVYLLGKNLSNHLFNHSFFVSSSWVFNNFVIEPLPHLEARQTALPGCTELVSELQLVGFGPSMALVATFGSLFGSSCADNYHCLDLNLPFLFQLLINIINIINLGCFKPVFLIKNLTYPNLRIASPPDAAGIALGHPSRFRRLDSHGDPGERGHHWSRDVPWRHPKMNISAWWFFFFKIHQTRDMVI